RGADVGTVLVLLTGDGGSDLGSRRVRLRLDVALGGREGHRALAAVPGRVARPEGDRVLAGLGDGERLVVVRELPAVQGVLDHAEAGAALLVGGGDRHGGGADVGAVLVLLAGDGGSDLGGGRVGLGLDVGLDDREGHRPLGGGAGDVGGPV